MNIVQNKLGQATGIRKENPRAGRAGMVSERSEDERGRAGAQIVGWDNLIACFRVNSCRLLFFLLFFVSLASPSQAAFLCRPTYTANCSLNNAHEAKCFDASEGDCNCTSYPDLAACQRALNPPEEPNTTTSNEPVPCPPGRTCLPNPLGAGTTVFTLIGSSIQAFLGIVGAIALVVFIYAGITWLTSAGNPDKIKKGKDAMVWTAISLAIIFSSYALVTFVISGFVK